MYVKPSPNLSLPTLFPPANHKFIFYISDLHCNFEVVVFYDAIAFFSKRENEILYIEFEGPVSFFLSLFGD